MSTLLTRDNYNQSVMASSESNQARAVLRAGNLYTPEEPLLDSFSKDTIEASGLAKSAPIQTLSPPVSPEYRALPSFRPTLHYPTHDAPLYPDSSVGEASEVESPLFSSDSSQEASPSKQTSRLSFEDRVARSGVTSLGTFLGGSIYIPPTRAGALSYYNDRMAELEEIYHMRRERARLPSPHKSSVSPRDPVTAKQLASLGGLTGSKPTGITKIKPTQKPAPTPKAAPKPKATRAASPVKAATPLKRTQRAQTTEEFHDRAFPTQAQPKHKRAAPTKKVEGKEDDTTWRELPDYCPPVSSLGSAPKPLRVQWKGNPLDISEEPDRDELHKAEYDAASELRLRPQQYLANKRRMFMARVRHLQERKNFTKTAAQNATNIDVNKTSRLWEAFDRVGWFDEKWYQEHLTEMDMSE